MVKSRQNILFFSILSLLALGTILNIQSPHIAFWCIGYIFYSTYTMSMVRRYNCVTYTKYDLEGEREFFFGKG